MAEKRDKALREQGFTILAEILKGYLNKTDVTGKTLEGLIIELEGLADALTWGEFSEIMDE